MKPFIALLACAALLARPAAAAVPVRTWLQVHADFDQIGHGLVLFDDGATIRADGSIHAQLSTYRSSNQLMPYWTTDFGSAVATGAAVSALRDALAEAQAGQLTGGCSVERLVLGTGSYRMTWYGRGSRRNTVAISVGDPSLPACEPAVRDVVEAVASFLAGAGLPLRGLGGLR